MLEKASPFIEVDDEDGLVPGRAARHSVEYRRPKGIAVADVRVRMIVIGGPVIQYRIDRVDKRDRRAAFRPRRVPETPPTIRSNRCTSHPTSPGRGHCEEIPMAHPGLGQAIQDGGQAAERHTVVETISLGSPLKQAVWKSRPEDRGEIVVARQVFLSKRAVEGDVRLRIVTDGVLIIGAGAQEAIHLAIVVGHAGLVIGVIRKDAGSR